MFSFALWIQRMNVRPLTSAEVHARLKLAQADIFRLGVRRLALFGSVQRNTARPDSDVDLLVEFEPGQKTYDHFLALNDLLEQLLDRPVQLVTAEALSPLTRPHVLSVAMDVVRVA